MLPEIAAPRYLKRDNALDIRQELYLEALNPEEDEQYLEEFEEEE